MKPIPRYQLHDIMREPQKRRQLKELILKLESYATFQSEELRRETRSKLFTEIDRYDDADVETMLKFN